MDFIGTLLLKKLFFQKNLSLNKRKNQFWKNKIKIDFWVYLNQNFFKTFLSNSVPLKYSQFF